MTPRLDVWFWAVLWVAFLMPFIFDGAHIESCERDGTMRLRSMAWLIGQDETRTFKCEAIP